ncbi:MAG: hypothetical protein HZB14_09585, partial [Actinobacteria bacterium]|nr:hypothetical protein [Actinomycetota bacterium]
MRVCLLAPAGSARDEEAAQQHGRWLRADSGHDVTIASRAARTERDGGVFDVAVGFGAESARDLFATSARRHALFVRTIADGEQAFAGLGGSADARPEPFNGLIAATRSVADALGRFAPGTIGRVVSDGVDKDAFAPIDTVPAPGERPLRVVVDCGPQADGKALAAARATIETMTQPCETVVAAALSRRRVRSLGFRTTVDPDDRRRLAERYQWADVLLGLDPGDDGTAAPLKAFHKGATCIVPATVANEHGVEHGWNGLIADPNDVADVARQLDRLSLDR